MRLHTAILFLSSLTSFGQGRNAVESGIGIVAIEETFDQSKIVPIYQDKAFKGKIEDFKLYAQIKSVSPFYFKPDYGICYFICLDKTENYYRVLINDKDVGFLKNDGNTFFKTWETVLLKEAVAVERIDIKTNPLRLKPNDNAEVINPGYEVKVDRLEVIDAIEVGGEYWIRVAFSKSAEFPINKETSKCGYGWIKWRVGNKLLINILLLC